jgi:hypothetical protein
MAQSALRALTKQLMLAAPAPSGMVNYQTVVQNAANRPQQKPTGQQVADVLGGVALPLSVVPFLGDIAGLGADVAMYANYPEERTALNYGLTLAGMLPFVPGAAGVRAAEGALDMSQAARMQRADDLSYRPETYYHASTSDIDEFKPKYDDGLTFITPNPEFANKWLGKGGSRSRLQEATADSPFYKQYKAERQGIWDKYGLKYGDDIDQWPETDRKAYWQESRNLTNQYDATDQVVYPLRTNVQNTFDPRQNEDVLIDYFRSKGRDPMASTISSGITDLDYYKTGNYLLFETPEMVQFLKNRKFDSMRLAEDGYNGGTFDTLAVFNPSNIRSVNAEFNPANRGSANLMAGVMGSAVGLSALRQLIPQQEQE